MAIDNLMIPDGDAVYYTEDFRHVLEDHMSYLRTHAATVVATVDPNDAYINRNDLYGYLTQIGLAKPLQWIAMRMNNYRSPTEFTEDTIQLLLPDPTVVQQLRSTHTAGSRIS